MKIGIVGTGRMGSSLGLAWAKSGHSVLFGSRDLDKAKSIAARTSPPAQAGSFDEAAAYGDVVLYTIRDPFLPSRLLSKPEVLAGKVVIDCNNTPILGLETPDPEQREGIHFSVQTPSLAERLAADVEGIRVVKAFNTVPHLVIELGSKTLAGYEVPVFLCSDDPSTKETVKGLAEELGFVGIDCGGLERSQLVEGLADFIRWQMIGMNLGPFASFPLRFIPQESSR
jgi:8-hydroxy-5-deazaflavin:NADPH oxidoreductase